MLSGVWAEDRIMHGVSSSRQAKVKPTNFIQGYLVQHRLEAAYINADFQPVSVGVAF
jgi:hypothetical protein